MIVANLATYPPRMDALQKTITRLSPQVDRLNIILNEYSEIPEWNVPTHVHFIIPPEDFKDCGKFYPRANPDDIVFLVDDDILYPPDYVNHTVGWLRRMPSDLYIVGYHGSIYLRQTGFDRVREFFRAKFKRGHIKRKVIYFRRKLDLPTIVDQLGTGVLATWGRHLAPFTYMKTSQRFVDVRLAKWCLEKNITPVCIPRKKDWLQPIHHEETIYNNFTLSPPPNVKEEIKSFFLKRGNVGTTIAISDEPAQPFGTSSPPV